MSIILYKTKNGMAEFEFLIEGSEKGSYRPYLIRLWRKTDVTAKHYKTTALVQDGLNRYIATSPPPQGAKEAERVAMLWAEEAEENLSAPELQRKTTDARKPGVFPVPMGGVLSMTPLVWKQIKESVGNLPAETGGPLGGSRDTFLVERFHFDRSARQSGVTYSPDYKELNRIFREEWNPEGINLLGFVHSHPPHIWHPSGGDLSYAHDILLAIPDLPYLLLPIVKAKPDTGEFELVPFAAVRSGGGLRVVGLRLEITEKVLQKNSGATCVRPPLEDTGEKSAAASNGICSAPESSGNEHQGSSDASMEVTDGLAAPAKAALEAACSYHLLKESDGRENGDEAS